MSDSKLCTPMPAPCNGIEESTWKDNVCDDDGPGILLPLKAEMTEDPNPPLAGKGSLTPTENSSDKACLLHRPY